MAGRKAPPKDNFLAMLLGKVGFAPAKKKKKRRRAEGPGERAPRPAVPAAPDEASAFAGYTQASSLGFASDDSYEAAAAAGFAPPPARPLEPLFPEGEGASLPFSVAAAAAPAPSASAPANGKLFSQDALDSSLDALFSGLEAGDVSPFAIPPVEAAAPEPVAPPAPEPVKTKLPFSPTVPLKMPDAPLEDASAAPDRSERASAPSRVATLPAFGGPVARAHSLELSQGVDLRALLATVDRVAGVAGSLLVGHDGLILVTSLSPEIDRDYLGAQTGALFAALGSQLGKMKRGELFRLVIETENGAMLMTAADMGILVVVSQDGQAMDVAAVASAIAGALGRG